MTASNISLMSHCKEKHDEFFSTMKKTFVAIKILANSALALNAGTTAAVKHSNSLTTFTRFSGDI